MPGYAALNELDAHAPVPPALTGEAKTDLACVQHVADTVERYAWAHHIDRLMIAGNLMLLLGTEPQAANAWFRERFADGYDWVMQANVTGMSLHADGGLMATKPYAAGGAYLKRMTGHCSGCRFDPRKRTGDDACPFTTLYWDFTARHHARLAANPRTSQAARGWERFAAEEQALIRARAATVAEAISTGTLGEEAYAACVYRSLQGQLLIAMPTLGDPNFVGTVVLITEHSDEGAMGLVLNRPLGVTVASAVPMPMRPSIRRHLFVPASSLATRGGARASLKTNSKTRHGSWSRPRSTTALRRTRRRSGATSFAAMVVRSRCLHFSPMIRRSTDGDSPDAASDFAVDATPRHRPGRDQRRDSPQRQRWRRRHCTPLGARGHVGYQRWPRAPVERGRAVGGWSRQ